MIRILTDTGSDIPYLHASESGVEIVELDVKFDEFSYDYRNDPDFRMFYENLTKTKGMPSTSQVNPSQYLDVFNDVKEKGDEMVVVTLSGGISGTYSSAIMAQKECAYDGITVVDSRHATCSQHLLVDEAVRLRDEGKSRDEIGKVLTELRERVRLLTCVETLEYLKKGGRVPPAMALIGGMLKIKPIVGMKDGVVTAFHKVRGFQAAIHSIMDMFVKEGYDESYPIYFGHTNNEERGRAFMEETQKKYNLKDVRLTPVGCVIGTHAGPDAVAIGYAFK